MKIIVFLLFFITITYSQIITLRRGGNEGQYSSYKVSLFKNGNVIYDGEENVKRIGIVQFTIDTSKVNILINDFLELSYFNLQNEYLEKITDTFLDENLDSVMVSETVTHNPFSITTFFYKEKRHRIFNYYGAPLKLVNLENKIDSLLSTKILIQ